jgi:hypothetical protein
VAVAELGAVVIDSDRLAVSVEPTQAWPRWSGIHAGCRAGGALDRRLGRVVFETTRSGTRSGHHPSAGARETGEIVAAAVAR